ncbi:MAG TPA: LysR family transcriptional regulator [Vicinamibacterales bacterium]|nr:LysR family transcriptional regulator [Vicinamibacterales bacterium]
MDIRQLQYVAALAREKHFTRAAKACGVTQPTLSGRIRQLEQELGVPIVERGQRFHGLTPEGERVLSWANAILDNWSSLQQDIASVRNASGALTGHLTMGVVPSALPMAALLTKAIQTKHPEIELTVLSSSSIDILKHLEEFSLDVGLTYLDNEPIEGMSSETIYMERYCLLVHKDHRLADAATVTWSAAAKEPLCLLTPDNQNRRIINRAFREAGAAPVPRLETNSVINLCATVHLTGMASVIPEYFLEVLGPISDVVPVPLTDPLIEHSVGLIAVDRDPVSPLVTAAFECAKGIEPPPISRPRPR